MALWDNERRILDEIEQQLSRADPGLAKEMESFGSEQPTPAPQRSGGSGGWKPWIVVGFITTAIIGLLAVLVSISLSGTGDEEASSAAQVMLVQ